MNRAHNFFGFWVKCGHYLNDSFHSGTFTVTSLPFENASAVKREGKGQRKM